MHQYIEEIKACGVRALRLDFTVEDGRETKKILELFSGGLLAPQDYAYTTGHYKKGVQ